MDSPLQYYYHNAINNSKPVSYDFCHTIWNPLCGDNLTLYVQLEEKNNSEWQIVKDIFFDGEASVTTKAVTSFFIELAQHKSVNEVLLWTYASLEKEWVDVTFKRRRAAVIGLLAFINWRKIYTKQDDLLDFDDLLDE